MGRINFGDLAISLWVCWYVYGNKNLGVGPDSLSDQCIKEKAEARLEREVEKRVCKCCRTVSYDFGMCYELIS